MDSNIFAQASRLGLRFTTPQGQLSVEDLWKLPISHANGNKASLESIGLALKAQTEQQQSNGSLFGTTSLTRAQSKERKITQLKFEIVKYVGETLVKEAKKREELAEARKNQQRIMELIQQKQDKELEGKSLEELQKLLQGQTANASAGSDDELFGDE